MRPDSERERIKLDTIKTEGEGSGTLGKDGGSEKSQKGAPLPAFGTLIRPSELVCFGLEKHLISPHPLIFSVPVEAVVRRRGESPSPRDGRAYPTGLYLVGDKILSYRELSLTPGFSGTFGHNEIFLSEVFIDQGDDGHIFFVQRGWTLISASTLHEELKRFDDGHRPQYQFPPSLHDL